MALVWPVGLPACVEVGWTETPQDTSLSSDADQGPAKTRETFATPVDRLSCSIILEKEQVPILRSFYRDDAHGRAVPFEWKHPLDDSPRLYRFVEPFGLTNLWRGGRKLCRATLSLEMLPLLE